MTQPTHQTSKPYWIVWLPITFVGGLIFAVKLFTDPIHFLDLYARQKMPVQDSLYYLGELIGIVSVVFFVLLCVLAGMIHYLVITTKRS